MSANGSEPTPLGWYDGTFGPLDQLRAPVLDRAFYFGDGVYDATIVHDGVILYEDQHVERFYNSARLVRMERVVPESELREVLHRLAREFDASNAFLYWQMSRATAPRCHVFPEEPSPNLMAYIVATPEVDLGVPTTAHLVPDTRFRHCNAKTLNLLPNVLAAQEAREAGFEEAIFVRDGFVTECAHSNVHILKDGALVTHPADELILPGIGRRHLIDMCRTLGIPVQERPFTDVELLQADEVVVTASSTFAQPVSCIDGTPVGGRAPELLARLQEALTEEFKAYVRENAPRN